MIESKLVFKMSALFSIPIKYLTSFFLKIFIPNRLKIINKIMDCKIVEIKQEMLIEMIQNIKKF